MNSLENNALHEKCTGCSLCAHVCPQKCISMDENEEGFLYPVIRQDECIKCNRCSSSCPELSSLEMNEEHELGYCLYSTEEECNNSSSGGFFYIFAKWFIENLKGIVYGCALNIENASIEHVRIDSIQRLPILQGSKYVQSRIDHVFESVENDLRNSKNVLFSGTPCQIAAIKRFVNNDKQLLTVDLICHGVPSPGLFRNYLEWIGRKVGTIKEISFRNHSWKNIQGYEVRVKGEKSNYKSLSQLDPYYHSFINELSYRLSCYNCQYTKTGRVGDITIGDCNSIVYDDPVFAGKHATSFVLVNSAHGKLMWEKVRGNFIVKEVSVNREAVFNKRLLEKSRMDGEKREILYAYMKDGDIFNCYPFFPTNKNRIRTKIKHIVPDYLLRMLRYYVRRPKNQNESA